MDDLVQVEVVHAACDAHGPVHQQRRRDLPAGPQHLVELALRAVLHDDAVTRSLRAHAPKTQDYRVKELNMSCCFFAACQIEFGLSESRVGNCRGKNANMINNNATKLFSYIIIITYDIVNQHHMSKSAVFPEYQHNCRCDINSIQQFYKQVNINI